MKTILINPLFKNNTSGCKLVPLGLAYIHSAIREEHDVEIINIDYEDYSSEIIEIVYTKRAEVVGFSIYEGLFYQAASIAKFVKRLNPQIYIVAGGPFATFAADVIVCNFKQFDFVIRGEGEVAFRELLSTISLYKNDYSRFREIPNLSYYKDNIYVFNAIEDFDINKFPIPSWDVLYPFPKDKRNVFIPICTSRGCWGNCTFCSFDYRRKRIVRSRDIANVQAEIELLINKYDQHDFFFSEPNFLYSKNRVQQFIEMLRNIKGINTFGFTTRVDCFLNCKELLGSLVELGCRSIELGVESGSNSQLQRFRKGTTVEQNKEAIDIIVSLKNNVPDFRYCIDLILFDPYCTNNEIKETLNFLCDNNLCTAKNELILYNAISLFQGTELRRNAIEDKLAYDSLELPYYDFVDAAVSRTYSFMILFMNCIQPILQEISRIFEHIFGLEEYQDNKNRVLKIKIGKLYYKRETVVFNYLRDILSCEVERECYSTYLHYEKVVKNIYELLHNLQNEIKEAEDN